MTPNELIDAPEQALTERDGARFYARGLATGMYNYADTPYDPDQPPAWLYDRHDEQGFPMTWDGDRIEGSPRPDRDPEAPQ